MFPVLLLSLLLFFSTLVKADGFVNPPASNGKSDYRDNQVWYLNEVQTLQWNTSIRSWNMTLWQQSLVNSQTVAAESPIIDYSGVIGSNGPTSFTWQVQLNGLDLSASPVFYLALQDSDSGNSTGFTSRYFNITATASDATASGLSPSSLSSPSSSSTSGSTSSGAPTVQSAKNDHIYVEVGIAVGVVVLLVLGGFLAWRLHNSRKARRAIPAYPSQSTVYHGRPAEKFGSSISELPDWQRPNEKFGDPVSELPAWQRPYEMDAALRRY